VIEKLLRPRDSISWHSSTEIHNWCGLDLGERRFTTVRRKLINTSLCPKLYIPIPLVLPNVSELQSLLGITPPEQQIPSIDVISLEIMTEALNRTLTKKGIPPENVESISRYLMNFFGFNDYVVDNVLNSKDRDVFYMLEEEGLLKTARDEVTIQHGKVWRIHYWVLNKRKINEFATAPIEEPDKCEDYTNIYEELSEDVWHRDS